MEECVRTPFTRPFWLVEFWLLAIGCFFIIFSLLTDFQKLTVDCPLATCSGSIHFLCGLNFWEELKQFCDKWKKEFLENSCYIHI